MNFSKKNLKTNSFKNGNVFIEDANNTISKFPLTDLSKQDQAFVMKKVESVKNLNTISPQKQAGIQSVFDYKFWIILFSLLAFGFYIYTLSDRKKLKYLYPVLFLGILMSLYSFTKKVLSTTDPLFLKSAFEIIKANMANLKDAFIKLVFKKFLVFIKLTIVNFFQLINASLALYEMIFSWILEITESTAQIFNLRVLRDIEILILFHV